MIIKCPGSQKFNHPYPELIRCPSCCKETEIWSDEWETKCSNCGKSVFRKQENTCLDWCAYAKECVGEEVYNEYLKRRKTMLTKKMLDGLTEQVNKELYSAYFYLGMSAYAASKGIKGAASWFYVQWNEELGHTKRIFDYVHEKGERVELFAVEKPPQDFTSIADLFEKTLAHEKKVTGLINALCELARKEGDKDTENFLQWFVKEQVEEEKTPEGILRKITAAADKKENLAAIDKELAGRK